MKFSLRFSKRSLVACLGLLVLAAMSFAQSNPTLVVVNGASFKRLLPLAPGAIASAFPTAANGFTGATEAFPAATPLPTTLGGAQILVGGVAAPLFYASAGQINFQVPFNTPQFELVPVRVLVNGAEVAQGSVTVFPVSLGIFQASFNDPEPRPGAIQNATGQLITQANPAAKGSVVVIYATGLGVLNGVLNSGEAAPGSPALESQVKPRVFIGGREGTVEFAGLTPGFVGLYQVNVRVPNNVLSGQNPLHLSVGDGEAVSEAVSIWIAD